MDASQNDDTDAIPRKNIKIMLGPCKFPGRVKCSCSSGSFVSSTIETIRKDTMCEYCGHLISVHEDFEEERDDNDSSNVVIISGPETKIKNEPSIVNAQTTVEPASSSSTSSTPVSLDQDSPHICQRQETVARIERGLKSNRALLIWGGSSTGKTTLARLLEKHLEEHGKIGIYISNMYLDEKYDTPRFDWQAFLWKFFSPRSPSTSLAERRIEEEVYFIIDEAQCTWERSSSFWTKFFIPYLWETSGLRFCFFGLGPPNKASSSAVTAVSSMEMWGQKSLKSTSTMSLYYSESEFDDVVEKYCSHAQTAIDLNRSARRYLYYLTNGHPKLVSFCLVLVDEISREDVNQPQSQSERRKLNLNAIKKVLENDQTVFGRGETGYEMGGPPPAPLSDGNYTITMLRILFAKGKLSYSRILYGSVMHMCYASGLLIMKDDSPDEFLVFPSPLHRRYIKWFYKT
ncbi:hypothetical protein TCE0_041f13738 [Talaromyces pinophilus]|uniref:Uncharacterized protein n=1 Tax=Talaromyces pinophilus TaxID=128442 RepID=A0A6V8HHS2_TALPI|nr:hypothetical protein TCE0_041f13738 [Talaromyces pinophilus]